MWSRTLRQRNPPKQRQLSKVGRNQMLTYRVREHNKHAKNITNMSNIKQTNEKKQSEQKGLLWDKVEYKWNKNTYLLERGRWLPHGRRNTKKINIPAWWRRKKKRRKAGSTESSYINSYWMYSTHKGISGKNNVAVLVLLNAKPNLKALPALSLCARNPVGSSSTSLQYRTRVNLSV